MGPVIVSAGDALIDLLVHPDGRLVAVPGGGQFNVARTIGRLGGTVAFLGRLSTDRFGGVLRKALTDDGVDLSMSESTESPTTLAIAELDEVGAASYRFHTAETSAPELSREAVMRAVATRPRALFLGTLGLVLQPMATALVAGVAEADDETLVILDPNCRPTVIRDRTTYLARLYAVMARADVVKVSTDDLVYLDPGRPAAGAARALLDHGPAVVLVTDGSRAVLVVTREGTLELAVPSIKVVDTIGAGDAFGGAFVSRWIERGSGRADLGDAAALRDAATFAIEVAAITCQRAGADPPRRAELPRRSGDPSH